MGTQNNFVDYRTFYDTAGESDFILPSEVEEATGLKYDDETLSRFLEALPQKDDIEWCKKMDYIFIPGPPEVLSMERIVSIQPNLFHFDTKEVSETCLKRSLKTKWIIIKKSVLMHEIYHRILSDLYEKIEKRENISHYCPGPAELAWAMLIYRMSRKKYLLNGCEVLSDATIGFDSPLTRSFPIMFMWNKPEDKIFLYRLEAMSIDIDAVTIVIPTRLSTSINEDKEEDLPF